MEIYGAFDPGPLEPLQPSGPLEPLKPWPLRPRMDVRRGRPRGVTLPSLRTHVDVAGGVSSTAHKLGVARRTVQRWLAGVPSCEPPEALTRRINWHLENGGNQYAPMPGVPALREAIADKTARLQGRAQEGDDVTIMGGRGGSDA